MALAAGVLLGTMLGGGDDGLPGVKEVEATLQAPGGATAEATVSKTGIGRVIDFRTGDLPILPKGEYYELWFVGPGDRPGRPDRISAGTFHPDEQGRSDVRFTAAVDPAEYPGLAVTAEPGDGDPAPSGPDVLRSSTSPATLTRVCQGCVSLIRHADRPTPGRAPAGVLVRVLSPQDR